FCGNAPGQAERTRTPQAGLPRPHTDGAAWPLVRLRGIRIPLKRESRSPGPGPATPGQRTARLRHLQIGSGRPAVSRLISETEVERSTLAARRSRAVCARVPAAGNTASGVR